MTALWAALLLGVLSGIAAAYLAQLKGRNPSHWFLWGFVFGPFGAIAAALASDETVTLPKTKLSRHL